MVRATQRKSAQAIPLAREGVWARIAKIVFCLAQALEQKGPSFNGAEEGEGHKVMVPL